MCDEWGGNGANGRGAFNEETIKFQEGFSKFAALGIFPGVYLPLAEKLRG